MKKQNYINFLNKEESANIEYEVKVQGMTQ